MFIVESICTGMAQSAGDAVQLPNVDSNE
jgi:hypothetical protein